ncbi:MAG: N-acetylmuramoyl-L-alanine amidase [Acidimicrobiales bacterium]
MWLPDVLRGAGLPVAIQPGWESRGRELTAVEGVICHHTASAAGRNAPAVGIVTNGRSDLPGPLSQLVLGRDGTFYVIAAGRANHAGAGNWRGITDGNGRMLGIEAENNGTGEHWSDRQMDSYRRGVAAILRRINRGAEWACGHKEYALPRGRKPDPTFDMGAFRGAVAGILAGHPTPPPPPPPQEDPEMFKPADGDATHHISAAHSGLIWDLPGLGKQGDPVQTYKSDGGEDQRWFVWHHTGDEVSLLSRRGTLALDCGLEADNPKAGQKLIVWSRHFGGQQRYRLHGTGPSEVAIEHISSGLYVDVDQAGGAGAALVLWEANDQPNQRFRLVATV